MLFVLTVLCFLGLAQAPAAPSLYRTSPTSTTECAAPPAGMDRERFLQLMAVDKKVLEGRLRLVLPDGLGQARVSDDFEPELLNETLDEYGHQQG